MEATYNSKEGEGYARRTIDEKDPQNIKLVGCNEEVKNRRLTRLFGISKKLTFTESEMRTVYFLRVRPPVFTLEKRGDKIVDERGFEYKAYDIYVTTDKTITFQTGRIIRIEGIPLPNPKTQKITLLVYKVEFPEETSHFDISMLQHIQAIFHGKTVKQRLNWILENFENYAQIVGRRNLAEACFLSFFSSILVRFNKEVQKGWSNIIVCGDTTTAKSETLRKMIMLLRAGTLITAETASTVGLTGAATQIEKEGWMVDWGFLVLCDRRLLAIDGAQKLSLKNWATLAEAERTGTIIIIKAGKGEAYARTRQIKICNAVDKEANKYSTKSLANFLYPCQALTTILDKTSIARLDIAVFADCRNVKAEDINKEFEGDYDEALLLLTDLLKWSWSNTTEVEFTPDAISTLLTEASKLYNIFFAEAVPLVSIDMKWKLARLSTAMAYLTLSTNDFKKVTVTKEHVEAIVEFLTDEYAEAGLNTLAQETRFEKITLEDVQFILMKIASKTGLEISSIQEIFKFIVIQGRITKDQLKTKFDLSENNQARPLLAELTSEKMIRRGQGFYPTTKLIESYKILNVNTINTFNRGKIEGAPKKFEEQKRFERGFNPTPVKHVNHVTNRKMQDTSIQEVLQRIRNVFVEGTQEEWIVHVVECGLSETEAENLFESLKGKELFFQNINGRTVWRWIK